MPRLETLSLLRRTTRTAQLLARRQAEAAMTATVVVARTDAPVFNPTTRSLAVPPGAMIYSGKAGITSGQGGDSGGYGDEPQTDTSLTIYIPLSATTPMVDDIVAVLTHPDDPAVVGRSFRVTDVGIGGRLIASRRLSVIGTQPSRTWRRS